jgi:hypothetical protein
MKLLAAIVLLAFVLALTTRPTIEEKVDVQIEESKSMHDSAMKMLIELHQKNDSLLIQQYFYNGEG